MKILIDLDGVIADFVDGIIHHHKVSICDWRNPGDYNICKNTNVPEEIFWKDVNCEFWENLKLTHDAHEIMAIIRSMFADKDIGIMTLLPLKWGIEQKQIADCILGKIKWLNKYFPNLTTNFFIGCTKHFIANENIILVDDSEDNINDFINEGGKGILYPRIWNLNYYLDSIDYLKTKLRELVNSKL